MVHCYFKQGAIEQVTFKVRPAAAALSSGRAVARELVSTVIINIVLIL